MELSADKTAKRKENNPLPNKNNQELESDSKKENKNEPVTSMVKSELFTVQKTIPVKIITKTMKAICKIAIKRKEEIDYETGFFMTYSDTLKCLMTNYHVINPSLEKENIEIEIYNQKKMKLKFNNRYTIYMDKPKDIAMIEIKESDEIYNDIAQSPKRIFLSNNSI